jgi:hypothetical protein
MKVFHTVGEQRDGCMIDAVFDVKNEIPDNIGSKENPSYPSNCWCSDGIYVDGGTNIIIERAT